MIFRYKVIIIIFILIALLSSNAGAAPLFGDVPAGHWAEDAVANLAAKGLVEGYPDGTFKGDRACSRWELAMVIARFLAKNDQEHASFATKDELEQLRSLVREFSDELEAIGVRVTSLEDQYQRLDTRVNELERIRFYGSFQTVYVSQTAGGGLEDVGSLNTPGIDWINGRLLTKGTGMSAVARLGVETHVAPEIDAGTEFAAYTSLGEKSVDQYWGVVPPYLSNPFLGSGAPVSGTGGVQPLNNRPWTRMTLDNFWMTHKPSQTKVTCGSYTPENIERFIVAGPKNPNIHNPEYLPFYGARVNSFKPGRLLSWEAVYATVPQDSGGALNYLTWMAGANAALNFERARLSVSYLRVLNEMNYNTTIGTAGIIPIPLGRRWLDKRTNTLRTFVGPQEQDTIGASLDYVFSRDFRFRGEYAQTEYNPDKSRINYDSSVNGTLTKGSLTGSFCNKRLNLSLDYLSISPYYDPFLLMYQVPPNTPVFLPYGTYYSNYWQLHDFIRYPSNRQGLSFQGSYQWPASQFWVNMSNQTQVESSTLSNIQSVGFVEPLFNALQGKGNEKGSINSVGAGISHTFPCKLGAFLNYYDYDIRRLSSTVADDISFDENIYTGGLSYPFNTKTTLYGNYSVVNLKGHSGLFKQDFRQDIPSIGLTYAFDSKTFIDLSYRLYYLKNYAQANTDWQASQTMMEYKVSF
ncbi:MAG: S-layer homology domain-containing protein [Candidatus Xenobiia bacterium LiM19]